MTKVAVLASGGGSNLGALIAAQAAGRLGPARLVVVGANVPGCGALERAAAAALPSFALDHKRFATRAAFDTALRDELRRHDADLIVLAGFMRVLGPEVLDAFAAVINIHPALLPSFPGLHAPRQAFDYGVKVAGCTVHFVDSGVDTGPIIAQATVPVLDDDDADRLAARILTEEHRLLPEAVRAFAEGRISRQGRRVRVTSP